MLICYAFDEDCFHENISTSVLGNRDYLRSKDLHDLSQEYGEKLIEYLRNDFKNLIKIFVDLCKSIRNSTNSSIIHVYLCQNVTDFEKDERKIDECTWDLFGFRKTFLNSISKNFKMKDNMCTLVKEMKYLNPELFYKIILEYIITVKWYSKKYENESIWPKNLKKVFAKYYEKSPFQYRSDRIVDSLIEKLVHLNSPPKMNELEIMCINSKYHPKNLQSFSAHQFQAPRQLLHEVTKFFRLVTKLL